MSKPEFSDFYRFLASLGTILIGLAITAPWLMLRESFDTRITTSELAELTDEAQNLIGLRQHYAYLATKYIGWVSLGIGLVGFVLLIAGLYLWWTRKQSIVDEKESLEVEKLRRELPNLSPSEIAQKAISESSKEQIEVSPSIEINTQSQAVKYYFEVEELVLQKLEKCFGDGYLLTNRKIGRHSYDAILLTRGNRLRDVVIEIKAFRSTTSSKQRIRDAVSKLSDNVSAYVRETHRKSIGIVLVVIDSESDETNTNLRNTETEKNMSLMEPGVVVRILSQKQLKQMNCDEFAPLLDFDLAT